MAATKLLKELLKYNYSKVDDFIAVQSSKADNLNRPKLHFTAPVGWMNDPNGLCQFEGEYHLFYQHHPFTTYFGRICWGHAVSTNLINWSDKPVALKPQNRYDFIGCWSGSAIEKEGRLHLFYTSFGTRQRQSTAVLEGEKFVKSKHNPIISQRDIPQKHNKTNFRDPKVIEYNGSYIMAVGGECRNKGVIYFFRSVDLIRWQYANMVVFDDVSGALECPDIFFLEGKFVVITSRPHNVLYHIYDRFILDGGKLLASGRLDGGNDFYAPQSFEDSNNRRIMIAWANAWNSPIGSRKHGYAGIMSIPRELHIIDNALCSYPVNEVNSAHENMTIQSAENGFSKLNVFSGNAFDIFASYSIDNNCEVNSDFLVSDDGSSYIRLTLSRKNNQIIVTKNIDGEQKQRTADYEFSDTTDLRVLIDMYTVEIFIDGGQRAFTSLNYVDGKVENRLCGAGLIKLDVYRLIEK